MRPWPEPGARKEEEAMKKLFALLMALTMTVQLVTPAWADAVEDGAEETTETVEVVQETTEATEETEVPEETEAETEETEAREEVTEPESEAGETTEEPTEETAEPTEIGEEAEDEQVAAVAALIEVLPSVEELEGMSEEEQLAAYEQIQGAFEAYDALSEEQKAQIPGAESLFESLFDYLNTQIADFAYSDSYQCGPNLFYNFSSSSGTLSFTGSGTMDNFIYDTIPWRQNSNAITSIVIPEGVTSIGDYAFYGCSKLKSVSLPSTLKSIGDEAFDGCTWLENISIPDGVTRIAKKAFYQCRNLTNVELPSSLKSIGEEAFTECKKLYSISIPYGAETLENGAFARCDGLTYVLIPDTVETIGNWAFTDCIALKVADIPKNVKIIGERAFKSCRRLETEVELKQITDLGEQAFYDCEKITSLVISSSSITEIPNLAFNSCYALQSVTLPDSVTRIGDLAFCGGAFSTFQNPKGLKSVGHSAFAVCKNLTSYVLPDGMTTIGRTLFQNCSSLSQVVIPGSVTLVEASAFDGCTSLTDIQFGGSQEDWNNISFGSSNTPVFSANIHYSTQATALGFGIHGSNISWKITLDGVLQLSGLGKMDAGTGTELKEFPWTEYSKKITAIEIQPGITSIAAYAFDGIQAEISIPLSVTEIGRNAVSASKLPNYSGTTAQWLAVNFDLAADYTHGAGAICNDGTVLDLGVCGDFTPEGPARYALAGDGCLRIYGAGQVTSAPWILDKDKITTVTIEEGITSICENAFQNYTKLTVVTFPESVINVGAGAFGGCAGLKTVHYAGTKEQWSQVQIGENNQALVNAALVCPQSHICTLEKVEEVPATCKKAGIIAHWRCTVCGKLFSDAEGSTELKVRDTVSAPVDHTIDSTTGKCTVCGLIGGKCGKTVSWALEASGVLRIYGSGEMSTDKGNIAWKKYAESITSIVIESGVTRIDKFAFSYTNCAKGTMVYIPLSVTRIDTPIAQGNLVYHYAGTIAQWRAISFYYADNYWEAPGAECTDGTIVTMGYCGTISKGPFYYLDGEGCLHIDGSGPISFYEYYYYRSYWENYSNQIRTVVIGDGVTSIPSYAFNNLHKLERISIPEGITCIRDSFKDTDALKEIKLPSTLDRIENSAFENSGLESIIIPEGVTSLSDKSFYGCKNLKSVQLPSTLRNLYEGYTFAYCINLTRINFPENLDHISQYAFQGSGIRSAKLPEGLTWVGASAFSKCGNLTYVSVPASATRIDGGAFADNPRLSKVDFQAKVDSLPDSIFKNCPALTSFVIPDGVMTIGKAAFSESGLKTVTIPITVTKIEDNAFASTSLTDVYFDGSQVEWEKITVGSGNDALKKAIIHFARVHVCQPEKVADRVEPTCTTAGKLEYWRCDGCGKLYDDADCTNELTQGQLTIPKLGHNMTKTEAVEPTYWAAGNNAYYTCSRCGKVYKDEAGKTETMVEAEMLEKLPSIATGECGEKLHWVLTEDGTLVISGSGEMSSYSETEVAPWFRYRMKINSLIVEKGITRVGYYAFYGCIKLTSVSLPEGVTVIGDSAFRNCTGLTEVRIPEGVIYLDPGAFYGCSGLISVDIPDSVKYFGSSITPVYPAVYQGGVFENCTSLKSITIPAGAYVARDTFINCSGLTDVIIKEGIKEIEERTFSGCSSLTRINIPESVTSIGESAFSGCGSLTSVTIPENVTSIGNNAFSGCVTLKTVDIPDGVTSIQFSTFSGCKSLTSVTIPDSIIRIGNNAFYGCSSLASVTIPEGVISIGQSAFSGCSSLTSIIIPDSVAKLESGTFRDCSSLTGVSIPENVTSIGESAFYGCSSLKNFDIPDGITSIEANTFYNCSGLENIAVPDSVKSLGDYAFYGCNGLTSFHIPTGVTSVGRQSFDRCTALASIGISASVTSVGYGAFEGCSNLKDVYYGGDEVAWKQIEIGSWNEPLTSAYLHYGLTHICTTHLIPAVTPTCITAGNNAYYLCDACGRVYKDEQNREQTTVENENLPALGHAMTLTEAKAATCTEDGNNAYYTCGNCHKVFLDEQGEKETSAQAEILPALGHSISIVNTVAPTCTEKGNRLYYTCATCGKAFKDKGGLEATTVAAETVPALGHTMTKTEAVAPTCTEKGTNAYYTCETCEKVFKDALGKQETAVEAEVLEALGHTMVLTEAKASTCTESGNNTYYTCKTCGKVYKDEAGQEETTVKAETIPALGHTMVKTEAVAPTCTESGNNAYYTCETCHKVYKDETGKQETTAQAEILKALGHAMTRTEPKAPTCTTAGTNGYYTCGTCHKVFKDQQGTQETTVAAELLKALGHNMVKTEAKAPTCTESGNNAYYTCQTCHGVFKDEAGKQATTVSAEQLAAFGHSMARTAAKEATCTTDGNHTYYTCRTCGKVYKDLQGTEETTVKAETIAALGHTMERTKALAPTCTESGNNTYYTCATCQKVFKDQQGKQETTVRAETVAALGHSMTKTEAVAPTCTESGTNAYYTCKTCRKVFKDEMGQEETTVKDETLAALGHTMTKTEAVAPSCTEKGNNAYFTCSTCHKVFKDEAGKRLTTVSAETLAAFGHSMVKTAAKAPTCTEPGNNTYYTCKTCGKVYQDEAGQEETTVKAETIAALGHTMTKTEAVAPTCTEAGNNAYYTCETCHKVYKDETGKQETFVEAEVQGALGHDMDKTEAVAPTHTSGGSNAYYTCKTCHKVFADAQGTLETTPEQERLPRLPGMADGKCGSLTWFISDEGKLSISGKGRMPDYSGSALAPWFDYREKILALEVEEGVLSMGDYAFFDCENLKTIQLPKSLTKLGKSCFVGCDSLALLDLTQLPKELTQKVTDLTGLAVLPETLSKLAGSKASFQWRLETIEGQPAAKNLAKLDGSQLTVLRSGTFRLVCLEEYTGLEASTQAAAQTTTVIRPEEREQLTSGEKLELSAWAMPFETELTADWTVTEESQDYATVTKDGILTAKSITKPVQVTVRAVPKNGEDPAEKSIWLLPKTIGMGILVNGHLVGDSLTAELTEAELNLIAQIQPQGAKTEVAWTSSREDVAEISAAGTVKLLKPGITLIRAQSTDGSGVSAELTLKVQYLDGAEKLTLTADAAVLELGRTAQLTLSGEDTIDPEHVEFQITQGNAAVVDAQGLLTAGNVPGKVTIVAALKDDPLQRRAQLTVEIVPVLIRALTLEPQVSQEWGYAEEASGESWVYGEVEAVAGKNRTFQINAQGKDYREQWFGVTNLTYESSDPAVAQVDAKGLVTLTAKEAGECVITVRCADSLGTETRLHIVLRDSAPRLESTKLTLNSNLTAGTNTALVESYNNTIQSVTLYDYDKTRKRYESTPSEAFTAEAEDGTLTVRALSAQKNGTYQLKLVVTCLGGSYDYTLQVKVANSLPKVTVKQIGKFDTFYLDSTAQLTAAVAGCQVKGMELIGGDTFRMDEDGNLFYAESYNPGDKVVTKGRLLVYVEGYQVPVEKAVTIATTKTAPKLTLNPSASAVNRVLDDPEFRVKVLWKGNALDLTDAEVKADVGFATVEAQGQYLVFRLTGTTGGTAKLSLRLPNWAQAVSLTHKITVDTKLPTVKLGTPTLKLNSLFSAQTAETSVWLTQGNLSIDTMGFVAAKPEGEKIALSFDPETDTIQAKFKEIPKAGTYSYTYTAYLENGTALPNGTIKVTVAATAPKVKLSAASVKLNRYLAGQEKATVKVPLTGGTGYQVTDFEGLPEYMSYDADTGNLTVVLPDETFTGETCTLYPVVREEESGQEVPLSTKLTLKVQTLNTNKLTVSLSAKGKLNTVDPDSAIAYTVTKVNNCLGTVESVDLVDQDDGDLFQADLDTSGVKPIVLLRLLPGKSYATNKTYKVRFRFAVCGKEVLSPVLSVKVTQTALKVTAPKTAVYYLSQSGPLRCSLKANLPLESVALSARTAKEFQQALGGQENLRLTGNRVEFKLTNPGALTAGKSYSVQLEFTPENAAENTKPTTIKLNVKVMK